MVSDNTLLKGGASAATGLFAKLIVAVALVVSMSFFSIPKAEAARCYIGSDGLTKCSYHQRINYYWCGFIPWGRIVRWQVPEGTPPAGGWPVAFYYQGTSPVDTNNSFNATYFNLTDLFGAIYEPRIIQEMLDNPANTGRKYAVMVPEPPNTGIIVKFWHTNVVFPYEISCDYSFFNDYFGEIKGGSYGAASQYNMNQRYAYGISSGGYNTSRMAVTFNGNNTWKALAVLSASYATCAGPLCYVPGLPSNHPPTRFWHGTADFIVPIFTMYPYRDKLLSMGKVAETTIHSGGHELNATMLGSTGIKAFFDRF